MNLKIRINSCTEIYFKILKVFEKEYEEPIWNGKELNYKTYSFYYLYKTTKKEKDEEISVFRDYKRLYTRTIEFESKSDDVIILVRCISDNKSIIDKAISLLKLETINVLNDLELVDLNKIDEYRLGKFLDTDIDKAMIPIS